MDVSNFLFSNGRSTGVANTDTLVKSKLACASPSSTENSQNNAWNVNFSDGNTNNNNKYNTNAVRAVAALGEETKEGWIVAYLDCCRNKKSSFYCNEYRMQYEADLWLLVYQVYGRNYTPTTSICFVVTRPKLREVFAANFRDRIVHHWICLRLEPLFEQRFIEQGNVSHNCRKGFGTKSAVEAFKADIIRITQNYTRKAWIAKFDICSFFMSIDIHILWAKLQVFIIENYKGDDIDTLLYLTEIVIKHRPQTNCVLNSPPELHEALPPGKSMIGSDTGVAIGNLPSQLCANFLMSFFDLVMVEFCKRHPDEITYERFVDDFATVAIEIEMVLYLRPRIEAFLLTEFHLQLHKDKFYIQEARKGVGFVGKVLMPGRTYISNRTVAGFVEALKVAEKICRQIVRQGATADNLCRLRHSADSINSYLGFLIHCASYKIRAKWLLALCPEFFQCCYIKGALAVVKIKKEYQLPQYLLTKEQNEYGLDLQQRETAARGNTHQSRAKAANHQLSHRANKRRRVRMEIPKRNP